MPVEHLAVEAIIASRGMSVRTLAQLMEREGIGDATITTNDEPVGIVTDRDIALAVANHADISELSANDIMTSDR